MHGICPIPIQLICSQQKKRHLTDALMRCRDSISTEISVFEGQGYSKLFTAPQNHRTSTFYAIFHSNYIQLKRSAHLETVGWELDWRIEAWFYGETRLLIPQQLNKIRSTCKFWNVRVPTQGTYPVWFHSKRSPQSSWLPTDPWLKRDDFVLTEVSKFKKEGNSKWLADFRNCRTFSILMQGFYVFF